MKLLKIDGPKAKRLADLSLHMHDLDFALQCLDGINLVPVEPHVLRIGLWRSAIVHYFKCFGDSAARFSLDSKVIYSGHDLAIENYEFFKALRNKNIVHDENSYTQSIPGAVLKAEGAEYKIAKILCSAFHGEVISQEAFSNLRLLITHATEWVVKQFDQLCDILTIELEAKNYAELLSIKPVTYSKPVDGEIHEKRNMP